MAQTLPNGVVIPEQTESISSAGVQELRTVGQTADASLAGKASTGYVDDGLYDAKNFASQKYDESISYASAVESASLARDADLEALIAGMEGMAYVGAWESGTSYRVNDVVTHGGDSWARLTAGSAGEPGADPAAWGLVARRGAGGGFGELSETDVTGLYDTVQSTGPGYDSGPQIFMPSGGVVDPANTGTIELRRIGPLVYSRINGVMVSAGAQGTWLWGNGIPAGYRPGSYGQAVDVTAGYASQEGLNNASRHRLAISDNDLYYIGYLHGATATAPGPARDDGTRRIYGFLPPWLTDDPIPT